MFCTAIVPSESDQDSRFGRCCLALREPSELRHEFGWADRPADEISLKLGAASLRQVATLRFGLDSLSDDLQPKAQTHRDHGVDDRCLLILGDDRLGKREIDFDRVNRESLQSAEHGVPRAEVIDGDANTEVSDCLEQCERLAHLRDRGALGYLELE